MRAYKGLLLVPAVAFSLILGGCLSGGGGGDSGTTSSTTPPPISSPTTADFFHLAVVPNQTVSTATFEVQVIAENIIPTSPPTAPRVLDGSGASHAMALKTLKWPGAGPGSGVDSVAVYSAVIPLVANQVNNIKAVSGTKEINFSIKHKAALNVVHATTPLQLVNFLQTATTTDPSIDVIEVDYVEADLGARIDNIGSNTAAVPTTRNSWLTLKPGTGSLTWIRDYPGLPNTTIRPKMDFLNLHGVVIGSDTSDGGGYQYIIENNHRIWVSASEFRAKYKVTWLRDTIVTAKYLADFNVSPAAGHKIYFTDSLWDGTASNAATQFAELVRDVWFNSHRGDINQFGKVVLNVYGQDLFAVKTLDTTSAIDPVNCPPTAPPAVTVCLDYTHNDGFQIWGTVSEVAYKGLRVVSPNEPAYLQPFLFDRTFTPNYSKILVDSILIEGAAPGTVDRAQLAGVMSNSRISNISFHEQILTIRQDFTEPSGAFSPTNVYLDNTDIRGVLYSPPAPAPGVFYTSANGNVGGNPADISPVLGAIPALSGAKFSRIKVQ